MYIAGLDIHDYLRNSPLSHSQGVEGIVWLTTLAGVSRAVRRHLKGRAHHPNTRKTSAFDNADTGIPTPPGDNIAQKPTPPVLVRILAPIAHTAIIVTPAVYLIGTAWYKLEQPEWFSRFALPDIDSLSVGQLATLRTVACVIHYGALYVWKRASVHMNNATASDKPTIPDQGPYSIVRHPMSAATLLGQATYALMWWNSIPLVGLAVTAAYMASSLPHEEQLREADLITGSQYTSYKKRVTSRIIPFIW